MKNKKLLIMTSIIILLPMLFGIILWDQLPETMATHFGANNEPNGWSSKAFTVFGIPAFLCAVHLLCIVMTTNDPKYRNINGKMMAVIYWIVPLISIPVMASTYAIALGIEVNIGFVVQLLIGIMFIAIGNYMPKARQNFTVGVKTPWALSSEENWNRTNRLGSWMFVIAGFVFMVNSFLNIPWLIIPIIVITAAAPFAYSFYLYKKGI